MHHCWLPRVSIRLARRWTSLQLLYWVGTWFWGALCCHPHLLKYLILIGVSLSYCGWQCACQQEVENQHCLKKYLQPPSVDQRALWSGWTWSCMGYWRCNIWKDGGFDEPELRQVIGHLRRVGCIPDPNQPVPWTRTKRFTRTFPLPPTI